MTNNGFFVIIPVYERFFLQTRRPGAAGDSETMILIWLGALVFVADRLTKLLITTHMTEGRAFL